MGKDVFNRDLVLFMKDNGKTTYLMVKEQKDFQIIIDMKGNLSMDINKEEEGSNGMMEKFIKVNFFKVKLMEMVNYLKIKLINFKENLKITKKQNQVK